MTMHKVAPLVGLLLLTSSGWHALAQEDCESFRCAFQQQLDACSCDGAGNHGKYVSCVAHQVKQLVANGLPTHCKGKLVRCAARSTCGKEGFVTCNIPVDVCDLTTLTCTADPTHTCATDADCGVRCKIKSSEQRCTDAGGTVGTAGTCCSSCVTTP